MVGAKTDERPERRIQDGQRHHHRHQRGVDAELDDHHPIERAHQQHEGHADGHLKKGQPQQARQGEVLRCDIGERKKSGAQLGPAANHVKG